MNKNYVLRDYDNNLRKVLDEGSILRNDRTGVGCKFIVGSRIEVDISERVPVLTKRKTNWKSMLKEYLWFLSGSDKIDDLNKMGSKVWDYWRDEEWALNSGFEKSSIGYGYGPNLIHYGGDINNLNENPGFNQIDYIINELKSNPSSRRILFTFWRPDKIGKNDVKLHPCHHTYQFIVEPDKCGNMNKLSCFVYQRSADAVVGVGSTNLQGAAFYTHMIAQQVNMTPSKLVHCSGHFHIYLNHIDLVKEYLDREEIDSPILLLNKKESMYEYNGDDFELIEYSPLEKMNFPIAV